MGVPPEPPAGGSRYLEWVVDHSRPSILRRREGSMVVPLSRPKPPEAVAEGQPLQGDDNRRQSIAGVDGSPFAGLQLCRSPSGGPQPKRPLPTRDSEEPPPRAAQQRPTVQCGLSSFVTSVSTTILSAVSLAGANTRFMDLSPFLNRLLSGLAAPASCFNSFSAATVSS